jgi:F0F1-type ATP synthase assembly protein I
LAQPENPRPAKDGVQPGDLAGVGLQFAASILLFLFVGMWLDRRLGTDPWLLIVGVFTGGTAGFYSMYRRLVIEPRKREPK